MKCLNCESELFENEFKDLQCTNCGSIYPFSNKGLSNGGCAKTEDIDIIDLINCLEARIGVYETCNARKDEAIRKLEAENEELKKEVNFLRATKNLNQSEFEKLKTELKIKELELKIAKAEAYKEVAEKTNSIIESLIEQYSIKDFEEFKAICQVLRGLRNDIDNLLKELVGD